MAKPDRITKADELRNRESRSSKVGLRSLVLGLWCWAVASGLRPLIFWDLRSAIWKRPTAMRAKQQKPEAKGQRPKTKVQSSKTDDHRLPSTLLAGRSV